MPVCSLRRMIHIARRGSLLATAVLLLTLGGCGVPFFDWTYEPAEGTLRDVADLAVGECVVEFDVERDYREVPVVPCADEHTAQVVGLFDLPAGGFPISSTVAEQGDRACPDQFASFAPDAAARADYELRYLRPAPAAWNAGHRTIRCVAYSAHRVAGSVAG
jgi:Septum formation